jgi:hypothetical protein
VDERPLECLEDEVAALQGLSALHRSGLRLAPDSFAIDDGGGDDCADAMTLYEIRLGILRAAFGTGRVKR